MIHSPTPSNPPGQAAPQEPRPEPICALLAMCVECGDGIELLLPIDNRTIGLLLAQHGWFISVMNEPGQGPEVPIMVLGPLCTACAQKVYPPEVFAMAEQRRQQLLQAAAQAAAQSPQVPR